MLIMLSCGQNSNKIIQSVSNQIDDMDCLYFFSVKEFISQCRLRHLSFDRIIFTSKFINNDAEMGTLCDFIRSELSSTEIVMILPKAQKALEDVFNKYFDSPMYTVMYVDTPTTLSIVDAIKLSIPDLKARYYFFDKPVEDKKTSKLGAFRGGKKNKKTDAENEKNDFNNSQTNEKVSDNDENKNEDFGFEMAGINGVNGTTVTPEVNVPLPNGVKKGDFSFDTPSSVSEDSKEEDFSNISTDDFDLSIGEFGSQHSDSGFVGDDDLDELEQFANSQRKDNFKENINNTANDTSEERGIDYDKPEKEKIPFKSEVSNRKKVGNRNISSSLLSDTQINIITGICGAGVTAFVVKKAMDLSNKGNKVLIVDLDYISNGLLSFIDVEKFYRGNYFSGINDKKVYKEDNIDIISNGYGVKPNKNVSSLLSASTLARYDYVLVDCPIECLSIISDNIFCDSNIIVCCISDLSKLIETTNAFYNRDNVSLNKELHIIDNCRVANKNIKSGDISVVKNVMLFTDGCWLDNC